MEGADHFVEDPHSDDPHGIQLLKDTKDECFKDIIAQLTENARSADESLSHLLGSLQASLHAVSKISVEYVDTLHTSVDDIHATVGASVMCMNQLLSKIDQLNKEMQPVNETASQIKDIVRTLGILENAVARLLQQQKKKKKR